MQRIVSRLCLILFLCLTAAHCASTGEQKKEDIPSSAAASSDPASARNAAKKIVVAKVNGAEITMHALVRMMNRLGAKKEAEGTPAGEIDTVKKGALDRLILQELAYQAAKKEGLRANPEAVSIAMANVKQNSGGDEGFKEFLEKEQLTEQELTAQVERSLTLEQIYAREVFGKVTIPEEELKKLYEQEKGNYIKPEKISLIDVFFPGNKSNKALMNHAQAIRKKILQDKNKDPWKLVLDGKFDVRTYEPRPDKDRELIEAGRKIKKGDISRVIKAPDGLHIIKLREHSPERQMTFEEIRGLLENRLRVPAQDKRLREWDQELRKDAVIEVF
jgi:parvulin-like peptidyl-prolyl isomerase